MSTVYEKIRKTRQEKGISQSELAEAVGYTSKAMISKIEQGLVNLSLDKLKEIASALGVEPADLWDWDDPVDNFNASADAELILMFHKLTQEQQESVMNLIKSMIK